MLELTPELKLNASIPLYTQLYEYIKNLILSGGITTGERLPSIRDLAKHLNLSKNTIITVYDQLIAEGYVTSKNRSGIFVERLENYLPKINYKTDVNISRINSGYSTLKSSYDLRNAQVDTNSFPYALWRKMLNQSITSEKNELLNYGSHQGEEGLRQQIARNLFLTRGVNCSADQILIGAGTQQSLTMLCMLLRDLGKDVAFEEPGYNGARQVFIDNNYKIAPIPLEADGINLNLLFTTSSKIVYITPSHQFPLGMVMPVSKRLQLLQWAKERDGFIIEDDYDGEFRYQGKPIPALQGLDTNDTVIYLGTFSKSLIPSIRVSYMVLPQKLLQIYRTRYNIYEQPVSRLIQEALRLFIEQGHWSRHIKKMRSIYKKKHDVLISSLAGIMGDKIEVVGKDAGLHVLVKVKNGLSEKELIKRASAFQVNISPTTNYWFMKSSADPSLIFIGFGGIKAEDIPQSIQLLKESWFIP